MRNEALSTTDNEMPWIKVTVGSTWLGNPKRRKIYLDIIKYVNKIWYIDPKQYKELYADIYRFNYIKPYGWYV